MIFIDEIKKAVRSAQSAIVAGAEKNLIKKGDFNYATEVDIAVQELLRGKLLKLENAQFLGEESETDIDWASPAWVVDPIDGTTNLMHGYNHSAVCAAFWDGEQISCGVIFDPYRDEMFWAQRGGGAYLNDEFIHVSDTFDIEHSLIAIETAPYNKELAGETFGLYKNVFERCRDLRLSGSAALDFAHLACGRVDASISRVLCPWDWAAGAVMVEEAGGIICGWDGAPLSLENAHCDTYGGNFRLKKALFGIMKLNCQ